ncbi:MAG: TSUP family transporter [Thiobacillus sp.]|nr:TSUP family transporter [Thiobacillus sp.]
MDILAILAGMATGMVLGLFGSGGSIVALPALLYLLDVAPKSAIAMSLGVVGVTATITASTTGDAAMWCYASHWCSACSA